MHAISMSRCTICIFMATAVPIAASAQSAPPPSPDTQRPTPSDPHAGDAGTKLIRVLKTPEDERDDRLRREAMSQIVPEVSMTGTTAKEALARIEQWTDVPVHIDWSALRGEGIDLRETVTLRIRGVSFGTVVAMVLDQLAPEGSGFGVMVKGGVLRVTSEQCCRVAMVTRVYDCRGLIRLRFTGAEREALREAIRIWFDEVGRVGIFDRKAGHSSVFTEGSGGQADHQSSPRTDDDILARIIKQIEIWSHEETMEGLRLIVEDSVSPQVWDVLGGAATMRSREASLVVRATPGTHGEVESLLNRLLAAAQE